MSELDDPFAGSEEASSEAPQEGSPAEWLAAAIEALDEYRQMKAEADRVSGQAQDNIERMLTDTIPNMMIEAGLQAVQMSDGQWLRLQPFVTCNVVKGHEEAAYAWMREHGHGGLVRENLSMSVPERRANEAGDLAARLIEDGWEVESKKGIHAATLKSWAKEMYESGRADEIPAEHFKASSIKRANIRKR